MLFLFMFRLFGLEKPTEPAPSLDDVSTRTGGRVTELDDKIKKLDIELSKYKEQLSKTKPGPSKSITIFADLN